MAKIERSAASQADPNSALHHAVQVSGAQGSPPLVHQSSLRAVAFLAVEHEERSGSLSSLCGDCVREN